MNHPYDDLTPYLLDELDAAEQKRVEEHLATCAACREELESLDETFVAMVERLPSEPPPPRVWEAIAQRTGVESEARAPAPFGPIAERVDRDDEPRSASEGADATTVPPPAERRAPTRWGALTMAAAIVVAATSVLWGWEQRQSYLEVRAEQTQITRWLTRPDVQARSFATADGAHGGTVLFQSDGRALVVMRDTAPPRQSYQAWGIGADGAVSLGVLGDRTLEVPAEGFEQIAVSLEPAGGSPAPTTVLGGVPTS